MLFIPAYFYLIKYSEGWTNRSIAGSIADGQPHQELVTRSYTVERVIDGNTIKLTNGERVRLIGIDAPESQPNNKAKSDAERTGQDLETINKMGQEATEFVKGLIKEGQEVRLEFDVQGRDKYGRTLAYVRRIYDTPEKIKDFFKMTEATIKTEYLDDGETRHNLYFECTNEPPPEATCKLYVNETIIKAGYATPMTMPPNVRYADLFKELYEEAREQKRGLWNKKDLVNKEYYDSGALRYESKLKYGIPYGYVVESIEYYQNGNIKQTINAGDPHQKDLLKFFYESGELKWETIQRGEEIISIKEIATLAALILTDIMRQVGTINPTSTSEALVCGYCHMVSKCCGWKAG